GVPRPAVGTVSRWPPRRWGERARDPALRRPAVGAVTSVGRRRLGAVAIALLVAGGGLGAPGVRAASKVDFAAITARSAFGQGVDVSEKAMVPDLVHRIEI